MENVMVVSAELVESFSSGKPFIKDDIPAIISTIKANCIFISRDKAEYAPEYKQIIPYAVLISGARYYLTRRLRAQTETRLHGMYSIGLGGHINPGEESPDDIIISGMKRELYEEVGLSEFAIGKCAGIINDTSSDVGNYHIGLVYPLAVSGNLRVRETSKMQGEWAAEEAVTRRFNEMESWSRLVWENRGVLNAAI